MEEVHIDLSLFRLNHGAEHDMSVRHVPEAITPNTVSHYNEIENHK